MFLCFVFSRRSCSWNHIVCNLFRLAFSPSMLSRFLHYLFEAWELIFYRWIIFHCMDVPSFVYLFIYWRISWLLPKSPFGSSLYLFLCWDFLFLFVSGMLKIACWSMYMIAESKCLSNNCNIWFITVLASPVFSYRGRDLPNSCDEENFFFFYWDLVF